MFRISHQRESSGQAVVAHTDVVVEQHDVLVPDASAEFVVREQNSVARGNLHDYSWVVLFYKLDAAVCAQIVEHDHVAATFHLPRRGHDRGEVLLQQVAAVIIQNQGRADRIGHSLHFPSVIR